jgi:hypothetical protein
MHLRIKPDNGMCVWHIHTEHYGKVERAWRPHLPDARYQHARM